MEEIIIDEKTKIIAKDIDDDVFVATNVENATIETIKEKGFIIDVDGNPISPLLPIGVLTKDGGWIPFEKMFNDLMKTR